MRKKLITAIKKEKPDVILMLSLSEKLLLTDYAVTHGIKVLWIEHDRVGNWLRKNPWLSRLKNLSKNVTTVVVSELSRKIYLALGWDPKKTIAIPNGIDPSRFSKHSSHPSPVTRHQFHLGCVARLTEDKGVDVLIEALRGLPQVSLDIVGKGRDENFIRNQISNLQEREMAPRPRIRLIPHVPDLGDFYQCIDALVLPSRDHDPFGLVAAEAMMLGIPVIVTDACGIAGYLENGKDALVVKADSSEALRKAILQLTDLRQRKQIAEAGEKTAKTEFSMSKMVNGYDKLLK